MRAKFARSSSLGFGDGSQATGSNTSAESRLKQKRPVETFLFRGYSCNALPGEPCKYPGRSSGRWDCCYRPPPAHLSLDSFTVKRTAKSPTGARLIGLHGPFNLLSHNTNKLQHPAEIQQAARIKNLLLCAYSDKPRRFQITATLSQLAFRVFSSWRNPSVRVYCGWVYVADHERLT